MSDIYNERIKKYLDYHKSTHGLETFFILFIETMVHDSFIGSLKKKLEMSMFFLNPLWILRVIITVGYG